MAVTASFEPGRISSAPGGTAAFTLRIHNDATTDEVVKLRPSGELARHTFLQSETIYLDPDETFDVPVSVEVGAALAAGPHASTIEISGAEGTSSVAEATIDVLEAIGYVVSLRPEQSRSSAAGRHRVFITNTGNTPVVVGLSADIADEAAVVEIAADTVTVAPGTEVKVEMRVIPPDRFWNGPSRTYDFTVHALSADGVAYDVPGTFEQGPRLRPWYVPALAGALIALVLGTIAWFALLRPSVERIAEDEAEQAILDDRAALRDRIAELELAAAEAEELPLGEPADLRLVAVGTPGTAATESFAVAADRVLSVTDVVFQNPSAAVGRVALLRNGDVLLESELANFRDLDFHFVAPFHFEGSSTIELRVECTAPGPGAADCPVSATIIGFVDQAR